MNHKLTKEEIEEQFEQFLKESVSDESVDLGNSPKSSVLNSLGKHNRKETKKDTKPWWINEDDSDNGHMLPTNQSYLKSQRFPQSIAETEEEQQAEKILLQSDERSSVSISRDSLEPNDSIVASGPAQTTFGPGLDTLEEEEEKEQFFANLETGASSTIDYSRLIKELESTGSTPINALNQQEDEFAALEEEETNEVESPRPKSVTASRHYSEDFEEDSVQIGEEFESNNNITKAKYILDDIEDAREAKEQEVKPGMLAKVILLDSLDSTLDTQKLLQSGDDRSMEKQSTDGKIGLDTASQMNTTAISGGQTNSDIEALHQAYRKIDQSLESTGAGQDSINGRDTNFAVHPQSHVGDSAKNISTTESDLPTVEELMKPIKGDAVFPRGFDLHSISTNAQQEGEVAATCSKQMDSSGPSLFQPQLNSNISCERHTYQEVSESSLKENANHTSRISDDVEALINEIKNDSASKHSLVASTSQAVSHRDYQIYAKAKSPSLTNKKHFGGNYTSVRSSGYGKVSSLKKDPLGASEKPTHLSPTKQAVPVKGFKTRSSPDHTKGRPKGQLFITQTIRSEKQKPAENNTSMQSSFTPLQRQMNSGPNHTKLLGGLAPEQLITRDNWELSKGNGQRLSEPGSVCRELVLLQKLEEAHEKWSTEHGLVEKLKEKLERKEEELVGKNEELKKLPQLNEEIYMLQSKLCSLETSKKKLTIGGILDPVTEEKLKLIEKEVQEQETIIHGYDQENERLCTQVKDLQMVNKRNEEKMFNESRHLMSEIRQLKEQLKKKNMKQVSIHDVQPSEQNKNQNIDDLVSQLRIQQVIKIL